MTITDKDREVLASFGESELTTRDGLCCWKVTEAAALKAIAQAREEGRREEREACAQTCARQRDCETDLGATDCAARFAAAIRARGNATLPAADAASED